MTATKLHDLALAVETIAAMPKAELHVHLDGSLRPRSVADLAAQNHLDLPVPADRLEEALVVSDDCPDLLHFLSYFSLPLAVLQTVDALERVTYELCEDVRRENVRYVEIRFAPSLHRQRGLPLTDIIEAVVHGWQEGRQAFGLRGGIILCGVRHLPPEETMEVARAGVPFLGNGVVGFDLAGDEANFPILLHRDPLLWARAAGYGMTAHAGEAAGPESVRDAIDVIQVSRVGHGVRAGEDAQLLADLRDRGIALDMCPTSNLQTRAISSTASHPLGRYFRYGVPVTISTDNRTVSNTTMTREITFGHKYLDLSVSDLGAITLTALQVGFAEADERQALVQEYRQEMEGLGIEVP